MSSNAIAIDGPCYVGKSTTAHVLAGLMDCTHVNTGHMYRAVAKEALHQGISLENILKKNGINKKLIHECTDKYFLDHIKEGKLRFINRQGLSNKKFL